eukprot:81974-Ditylum_brightwellii.AAC.1
MAGGVLNGMVMSHVMGTMQEISLVLQRICWALGPLDSMLLGVMIGTVLDMVMSTMWGIRLAWMWTSLLTWSWARWVVLCWAFLGQRGDTVPDIMSVWLWAFVLA